MKVVVLKTNLKQGLEVIGRISGESMSNLPVLKNCLVETDSNRLKLSATNLELAATAFVSGKIIENGGLTVPFGTFNLIVSNLQAERINLEGGADYLIVKTDNYEARIQGIKKEEFPIIPKIQTDQITFAVEAGIFGGAVSFAAGAAESRGGRPELNGVLFEFSNNILKFAATDSFRLAEKKLSDHQFTTSLDQGFKSIIPLKTVQEVARIMRNESEKISICFNHNQVFFGGEGAEIISRLTAGDFPDYEPIVPKEIETEAVLKREELASALKLASAFADRLSEVKVIIKDKAKNVEVFSASQSLGENRYLIPAKIKGGPVEVVFNWRFLLDGLKTFAGEEIFLGFNGGDKPVILKTPGDHSSFYILAPLKSA